MQASNMAVVRIALISIIVRMIIGCGAVLNNAMDNCGTAQNCTYFHAFALAQLIRNWGYPVETHYIPTEDDFVLMTLRIPASRHHDSDKDNDARKRIVICQHGLLDSAESFVNNLPNESLAYILADRQYDVWLPNNRGNAYSMPNRHTKDAWAFSWDEMAQYDVPAIINYILEFTGQSKLSYIGHSQGTTQMFAHLASDYSSVHNQLNIFISLAPAVYVGHQRSSIMRELADLKLDQLFEGLGITSIEPGSPELSILSRFLCTHFKTGTHVCDNIIFALFGTDGDPLANLNMTRLPLYLEMTPAGSSAQTLEHWAQMFRSGSFAKFNYGRDENMKRYGTHDPPIYDLNRINARLAIFSGSNDALSDAADVEKMIEQLPQQNIVYREQIDGYQHIDFTWSYSAAKTLYENVISLLERYDTVEFDSSIRIE